MNSTDITGLIEPKFLNGEMVGQQIQNVTITSAKTEVFSRDGEDETKVVITLAEFDKPWSLNVTQTRALADFFGTDLAAWTGKRIAIAGKKLQTGAFKGKFTIDVYRSNEEVPFE